MPLLPPHDDCISCGAPVVRSFATFEPLPVVEFELADGITDEEATRLLASEPELQRTRYTAAPPSFQALSTCNFHRGHAVLDAAVDEMLAAEYAWRISEYRCCFK